MKRAVILEINGNEAIVMTKDGDIVGIRNRNYEIGQEINIKNQATAMQKRIYPFVSVAAIAAAALLILGGTGIYFIPYGTVSLDINPSIEYTINRFDRVLNVSGVNDDGSDILSNLDTNALIHKEIEDAVDTTIEQIEADGYMTDENENYIVVSANTKAESHTDKLLGRLDEKVKGHGNVEPLTFKVTDDELGEAHKEGISGGKWKMVDTLEEVSDETIDRSEWSKKSVREIVNECDRIKAKPYIEPFEPGRQPEQPGGSEQSGQPEQRRQIEETEQPQEQADKPEPPEQADKPETPEQFEQPEQPEQRRQPGEMSQPPEQPERPEQNGQPGEMNQPPEQHGYPEERGGEPPADNGNMERPYIR